LQTGERRGWASRFPGYPLVASNLSLDLRLVP
jgi:hypothetical protein